MEITARVLVFLTTADNHEDTKALQDTLFASH